jgi:hypothetical protein
VPLQTLKKHPETVVHHSVDSMAGPDVFFLARHKDTTAEKPVVLQLKNRKAGGLLEAIDSLCWEKWKGGDALRTFLDAHESWKHPVRCVVGARSYEPALLQALAWYNTDAMQDSPVVCLRPTAETLGSDVMAITQRRYGLPRLSWPACLALPGITLTAARPSCRLRITGDTKKKVSIIVASLRCDESKPIPGAKEQGDGSWCAIVPLAHFEYALEAVRNQSRVSFEGDAAMDDHEGDDVD